jgi:hypothetical protein
VIWAPLVTFAVSTPVRLRETSCEVDFALTVVRFYGFKPRAFNIRKATCSTAGFVAVVVTINIWVIFSWYDPTFVTAIPAFRFHCVPSITTGR